MDTRALSWGQSGQNVKFTAHLDQVSRLKKSAAKTLLPLYPYMPSGVDRDYFAFLTFPVIHCKASS